jgi:hypothetical protein
MEIRRKPTATPKPPTASQLRQQEEAEGRMAYEEAKKTGIGGQAIDYWERAEKQVEKNVSDGKTHWVVGGFEATGAKVMGFFARLANIHEVEGRAAQLGYEMGSAHVTTGDKIKTGLWLGLESFFAATNFTGLAGLAKGAVRRQAAKLTAKEGEAIVAKYGKVLVAERGTQAAVEGAEVAGKAIKGMLPARAEAAALVRKDLAEVIAKLPAEGKLKPADLERFAEGLKGVAKKYGIDFSYAKGLPEVTGDATRIHLKTMGIGDWHEYSHMVQMIQSRATALESHALRLGKDVSQLSKAEIGEAFKATVSTLETQGYRHFEEEAVKAVGFMGKELKPSTYKQVLLEGLGQQERALVTATAPNFHVGVGGRLYGDLTVLGESQAEIMANLSPALAQGRRYMGSQLDR